VATHLTRKELKQDNVALRVEETFGFLGAHRKQTIRIVGGALALILIVAAVFYYRSSQREVRQQMLGEAIAAQNAPVGTAPPNGGLSFPSEAAKKDAVTRAYQRLINEHSGSSEAYISEYSLASMDVENGKNDDARKKYQDVIDHADSGYASLAKLAMAQLDFATNRGAEAETLLRDLMDHPTELVSKSQAAFSLARGISQTKPEEARKLLLPLSGASSEISQAAVSALADLPPQK